MNEHDSAGEMDESTYYEKLEEIINARVNEKLYDILQKKKWSCGAQLSQGQKIFDLFFGPDFLLNFFQTGSK